MAGALELPAFFVVPLLALVAAGRSGFNFAGALRDRRQHLAIVAAPVIGAVAMGILLGRHWGYYGRIPFFAFPPALLLTSMLFSRWVEAGKRRFRLAVAAGSFAAAVAVSMASFPSGSLAAAFKGGAFGVTPHTYAESGQVFQRFAAAADLTNAAILTSDVGGLALCCDEFEIVDFAFLSNRKLAHEGPRAIAQVLDAGTAGFWSRRTGGGLPSEICTSCRSSALVTRRRSREPRRSGSDASSPNASNETDAAAGFLRKEKI